jgi:hypothetical protein
MLPNRGEKKKKQNCTIPFGGAVSHTNIQVKVFFFIKKNIQVKLIYLQLRIKKKRKTKRGERERERERERG